MVLESDDDRDRRRTSESSQDSDTPAASPRPRKKASPGVGNALREAYQEALREEVPPEMLDLLGKLG